MKNELEECRGEVFNVEYILNGLFNLKNAERMPLEMRAALCSMAISQIENGLGKEHCESLDSLFD